MRKVGKSEYIVSDIGFGGMPLSLEGRPSEEVALEIIHAALNNGITFFDTADVYCKDEKDIGHNERLMAKALQGTKDVVIATKGGMERPHGSWTLNADPKHLQQACENSLKALGTEQIQLYQLHAPDPNVSFVQSIECLAQLQKQGKIKYLGLSNVSVVEIETARQIVEIVSVQNRCNLYHLSSFHNGVIEYCTANEIAFIPYSPVGGSYGHDKLAQEPLLINIAKKYNAKPLEIALAWLLAKAPNIIPIPAASRVSSVLSSASAMNIKLATDDVASIDQQFLS